MNLYWLLECPWPMRDREYIMQRRVCRLYASKQYAEQPVSRRGSVVELYLRLDIANDSPEMRAPVSYTHLTLPTKRIV